ncbi:MAG: Gfo/Idh/MocA family protein [Chloroflexota bacterium]
MGRIRVGVLGCGGIARTHVRDYYRSDAAEVDLVACADVDAAAAARFAADFEIPNAYGDPGEVLASKEIDVVDVCSPPTAHPALIRAAAEAGKHVICEKPLGVDYAEAAGAVAAAEKAGVKVGVMQNYRWRPEYVEARNTLASGRLGKPMMATLQGLFHWYGTVPYRLAAKRMLLIEMTIHYVDLLRFTMGSDITRVYAAAGRAPAAPAAGETYTALIMHFANGAIGSIVNSGECQGAMANWGGESVFQAEYGTIYLNYRRHFTFEMYSANSGGRMEHTYPEDLYSISTNIRFTEPIRAFYRAIGKGHDAPVTGRNNLNTLAAVLAAYESVETGQAVDVQEFVDRELSRAQT